MGDTHNQLEMSSTSNDHQESTPSTIDNYSTANNLNDSLFDDAIDPFEKIAISERTKGQDAGRRAGYLEGRDIGRCKGWEIGLELGYIHSFSSNLLDVKQRRLQNVDYDVSNNEENDENSTSYRSNQRLDRCLIVAQELIDMINLFPDPDTLLEQNRKFSDGIDAISKASDHTLLTTRANVELNDSESASLKTGNQNESLTDISSSLQRIRAKFKLLLVLLRTNRSFDLKRILNAADNTVRSREGTEGISDASVVQQSSLEKAGDW
jgi:hypothetical protein